MIPHQIIILYEGEEDGGGFRIEIQEGKHFPLNAPDHWYAHDLAALKRFLGDKYGWPKAGRPKKEDA